MKRLFAAIILLGAVAAAARAQPCDASGLLISFNPPYPLLGEKISITVTNITTSCTYTLGSSCLYTKVYVTSCSGPVIVPFRACSTQKVLLTPGKSYTDKWNQTDWLGNPVGPGIYAFEVQVQDPAGKFIQLCPTVSVNICTPPPVYYGTGSPGTGAFQPVFNMAGAPMVGNTNFAISVYNALGGAPAMLFVGAKPGAITTGFGTFLIDPTQPLLQFGFLLGGPPGQPGGGAVTFAMPIPNQPALIGATVCFQTLIADPGSTGGIATTNGLQIYVCQ